MTPFKQATVISGDLADLRHLGPLFDAQLSAGPSEGSLALICDAKGYAHAVHLKRLLRELGREAELWLTPMDRGLGLASTSLETTLEAVEGPFLLNLGAGGGQLGVIATKAFQKRGWPITLCDQGDLYSLSQLKSPVRLNPTLSAPQSLRAFGVSASEGLGGGWFEEHLVSLATSLLYDASALSEPLEVLHRLAERTGPQLISPHLRAPELMTTQFQPLLERFERAGCCELFKGQLKFSSEAHRQFCAGGWVSLYAYEQLKSLFETYEGNTSRALRLSDLRQGLDVTLTFPAEAKVRVDLACLVNERLYLIFCPRADQDAFYEQLSLFKALKETLPCEAIALSHAPSPLWRRADDLGVKVCPPEELHQLGRWLEALLTQGEHP